jgi:tetratricopeptide (TPR) repeat protein
MMKSKITIPRLIGFATLLLVIGAGWFVARWAMRHVPGQDPASREQTTRALTDLIPARIVEVVTGAARHGDDLRAPRPDAIESVLAGLDDVPLPTEAALAGISAQTRDTLRLRYNLGLLRFHQGDTPGAIAAFQSVLEIDPQGAYGLRSFLQIGIIRSMMNDWPGAVENFAKAVALEPGDPLAAHNLGVALRRAGRLEEAIPMLSKAATLDAANPAILTNLGNVLAQAGRLDQAEDAYRNALKLQEKNGAVRFNLGLLQLRRENLAEAEEEFQLAAGLLDGPAKARAAAFLGTTQYRRGFFGRAAESFGLAARVEPDRVDHLFNRAVAWAKSGMAAEAARSFDEALKLAPGDAAAWFGLGGARYVMGRRDEALAAYDRGLAIDSVATAPIFTVGFILFEGGKIEEAATRFRRVIAIGGQDVPRARVNLGLCLEATGRFAEAAREYEQGDPTDPRTWFNLGLVRRRLGNVQGAIEAFTKASELRPGEARYAAALGDAFLEGDHPSAAVSAYERAVKNGGDDFEILIRLARISMRLEKIGEASSWAERALKAARTGPEKARASIAEGLIHDRRGDLEAAIRSFRRATNEHRGDADAFYNLGVLLARVRSWNEAVDALRVAVRLDANHAAAWTQLGNVFAARGLRDEAVAAYQNAVRLDSAAVEANYNLQELTARR